jgi:hypothetical protein
MAVLYSLGHPNFRRAINGVKSNRWPTFRGAMARTSDHAVILAALAWPDVEVQLEPGEEGIVVGASVVGRVLFPNGDEVDTAKPLVARAPAAPAPETLGRLGLELEPDPQAPPKARIVCQHCDKDFGHRLPFANHMKKEHAGIDAVVPTPEEAVA